MTKALQDFQTAVVDETRQQEASAKVAVGEVLKSRAQFGSELRLQIHALKQTRDLNHLAWQEHGRNLTLHGAAQSARRAASVTSTRDRARRDRQMLKEREAANDAERLQQLTNRYVQKRERAAQVRLETSGFGWPVTWPLCGDRYMAVTWPSHGRYMAVAWLYTVVTWTWSLRGRYVVAGSPRDVRLCHQLRARDGADRQARGGRARPAAGEGPALPISPHISPYLPISPHISPYLR